MKRIVDVAAAVTGLVITGPVLAVSAILIKVEDGGPVLFSQRRVGQESSVFRVYKLRTMSVDHGTTDQTYDSSPGVTRVGRTLRRSKVDELPQLWNVLRGDMSLVGPRPCLPETVADMPDWARRRFAVRPGLTGLAQVNGNAALPWPERWRYDVAYVDGLSCTTDARILAGTLGTVVWGENRVAARGLVT